MSQKRKTNQKTKRKAVRDMRNELMKGRIKSVTENPQKKTDNYDLSEITKLLEDGMVHIPKEVMKAEVYDESKMMFGSVFTECMKKLTENDLNMGTEYLASKLREMIKETIAVKTYHQIWAEGCCYSPVKAEIVRKEVAELADTIDLTVCFAERSVM